MKKLVVTCCKRLAVLLMAMVLIAALGTPVLAAPAPRLLLSTDAVMDEDWAGTTVAKGYFSKANKRLKETTRSGNVKFVAELEKTDAETVKIGKAGLFCFSQAEVRLVAAGKNGASQFVASKWTDSISLYGMATEDFNPETDALYLHISYVMKNGKVRTYDKKVLADKGSFVEVQIGTGLKTGSRKYSYAYDASTGLTGRLPVCHTDFDINDVCKNLNRTDAGTYLKIQMKVVRTTAASRKLSKSSAVVLGDDMIAGVHNGEDVVTP